MQPSPVTDAAKTKFRIQHSVADGAVPRTQSASFVAKLGPAKATLHTLHACPSSGSPGSCSFHGPKGYAGADRDASIADMDRFYRSTCGY